MNIPVIIIGYNNYYYIKKMVDQLKKYNLNNIYVIDNNSSLPILLNYYKNHTEIKIIKMNKNYKSKVLFDLDLRSFYNCLPNYFIYTDADIMFNEKLPLDFVNHLIYLSDKHRIGKVGFALDISEKDKLKPLFKIKKYKKIYIKEWEQRHWDREIEKDIYRADIATTFAVYNKKYFDFSIERHFLKSLRVSGNFTAKHLQWYENSFSKYEQNYYFCNSYYEGWNHFKL